MVTSSAAGEAVRDEPLDTVETVETGDRVPDVCVERDYYYAATIYIYMYLILPTLPPSPLPPSPLTHSLPPSLPPSPLVLTGSLIRGEWVFLMVRGEEWLLGTGEGGGFPSGVCQ